MHIFLYGGVSGDTFVSKIDTSGNFIWAGKMGGNATDKGISLQADAAGNVCVTGTFQMSADFDPGSGSFSLSSNGQLDIFICKLGVYGNLIWAKGFGSSTSDYGNALSLDSSGNVYTTGQYFSTVDFDPGAGVDTITSAGTWDIYIHKLDASGNYGWAQHGRNAGR